MQLENPVLDGLDIIIEVIHILELLLFPKVNLVLVKKDASYHEPANDEDHRGMLDDLDDKVDILPLGFRLILNHVMSI